MHLCSQPNEALILFRNEAARINWAGHQISDGLLTMLTPQSMESLPLGIN
jgi:hypothetical protein